jgi:hypothetical protein
MTLPALLEMYNTCTAESSCTPGGTKSTMASLAVAPLTRANGEPRTRAWAPRASTATSGAPAKGPR